MTRLLHPAMAATVAILLAPPLAIAQTTSNDFVVASDHVGPIRAATSATDLRRLFGAKNVVDQMLDGAEGEQSPGSVVLPNSPDRVEIFWADDKKTHVGSVRINTRGGHWHTAIGGVKVGTPLTDLAKRNAGKPIHFSGFDWDYGGYIKDWSGGPLGKTFDGRHHLTLRLGYDSDRAAHLPESTQKAVEGEKTISSSDAAVRAVQPRVDTISVDF